MKKFAKAGFKNEYGTELCSGDLLVMKKNVETSLLTPKSLGASMQFASSDISGLKKSSDKEAETILSNSNIKIAMETSD